jgi:hypothetical protein
MADTVERLASETRRLVRKGEARHPVPETPA